MDLQGQIHWLGCLSSWTCSSLLWTEQVKRSSGPFEKGLDCSNCSNELKPLGRPVDWVNWQRIQAELTCSKKAFNWFLKDNMLKASKLDPSKWFVLKKDCLTLQRLEKLPSLKGPFTFKHSSPNLEGKTWPLMMNRRAFKMNVKAFNLEGNGANLEGFAWSLKALLKWEWMVILKARFLLIQDS